MLCNWSYFLVYNSVSSYLLGVNLLIIYVTETNVYSSVWKSVEPKILLSVLKYGFYSLYFKPFNYVN